MIPPITEGELTDNERRERNEQNRKGTTFTNEPPTTKPYIPGAAPSAQGGLPNIPGVMQERSNQLVIRIP